MEIKEKSPAKPSAKKESFDGNSSMNNLGKPKGKFGAKKFGKDKFDPTKRSPKKFDPKKKKFIKGKFDSKKKNGFPQKKFKKITGDITKKVFRKETEGEGEDPLKFKKSKLSPAYFDAVTILRKMSLKKGSINSLISTVKDQKVSQFLFKL